ncbi:transposase [Streptomyces sp. NPDC088812]|uniref:IS256 family transposase n=1 Tax=Streptomyces sp. NPDC088812 TaxID=3365905 RepID=UPI003827A874
MPQSDLQRLLESLRTAAGIDLVRSAAERMLQELIEAELRTGAFFPGLLERRRRIDQAFYAVIMEAYVQGMSTRSVAGQIPGRGLRDLRRPRVQLTAFRERPLNHTRFPYIYLDATYCKVRVDHQIVSQAVVIATGITEDGNREVLGVVVGDNETEAFWTEFLRSLRSRGLSGVRLVLGDNHAGLVAAIRKVMLGSAYRRCRVHFLRNV